MPQTADIRQKCRSAFHHYHGGPFDGASVSYAGIPSPSASAQQSGRWEMEYRRGWDKRTWVGAYVRDESSFDGLCWDWEASA